MGPLGFRRYLRCYLLPPFPRSAQLRPQKARCQPYPLPPSPLLHDWFRSPHLPRLPAVPCLDRPRAHLPDVRCQEHDDPPPTPVTAVTSLPPPCSVAACPPRKLTSRCSTFRTRTLPTSLNGFPTTSSPASVTSHQRASRCPLLSSETLPPSKRCSRESESSSPLCSAARPSSTGTPVKVWTRWNSPKPSPTRTISFLSTSSTRTLPPRTRRRWTRRRWNDLFFSCSI